MRIYVSVDMEGGSGVCLPEQVRKDHPLFAETQKWLLSDVNAVAEGAFEAGASEVIIMDAHGGSFNIPFEGLHPDAKIIYTAPASSPRFPLLDSSFGALFLLGYHAKAGTRNAVLEHTMNSQKWHRATVNGREIGEIAIDVWYAGAVNVPVALVTGDDKTCAEAKEWVPNVETVTVKTGLGRHRACCLALEDTRRILREGSARAVRRSIDIKPVRLDGPATVEITFKSTADADAECTVPGTERLDGYRVRKLFLNFTDWYGGLWKPE